MSKFLIDANLSIETKKFLENLGYNSKHVREAGLNKALDDDIVNFAIKEKRVIITLDLDFGEIYYFGTQKNLGIIVLKLKSQTIESVNNTLENFLRLEVLEREENKYVLIMVSEDRYRIRRKIQIINSKVKLSSQI